MGKKRIITKGAEAGETETKTAARPTEAEPGRRVASAPAGSQTPKASADALAHRTSNGAGIASIQATYNNTIITVSDPQGNVLVWSSAGSVGFSGTKKATPYAAARVAEIVADKAKRFGVAGVVVRVSGVGSGRDSAIRSLANHGLNIISIKDVTPLPHNGPRPPKVRRV